MAAFNEAFIRAADGLDWSYPCLIWVADYLRVATGRDPAEGWRAMAWDERTAKGTLARLAVHGEGASAVERALDVIAKRDGWREIAEAPLGQQGALAIGVYTDPNGEGYPAIFDGWRGWLVAFTGKATILREPPGRMWEIVT